MLCTLCPHECGIDRNNGSAGFCQVGSRPKVSHIQPNSAEERNLCGVYGSGMLFLTGCNMRCVFCQNYDINIECKGEERSIEELARMMLDLQCRSSRSRVKSSSLTIEKEFLFCESVHPLPA